MSEARGDEYLESVYLFGTPDEIVAKLQARVDAGVRYFVLHTMTPDPRQLEDWLRVRGPERSLPCRVERRSSRIERRSSRSREHRPPPAGPTARRIGRCRA